MLEIFGLTDPGRVRPLNEDAFVIRPEMGVVAVCDGLGGQNAGEVASRLTVENLVPFLERSHEDTEITWPFGLMIDLSFDGNRLFTAIGLANKRVTREAESRLDYSGMGSTVVAAIARGAKLTLAWLGDSRAYLIRQGVMRQLTKDHTWLNMALAGGIVTPEEAEKHPWKDVLTKAVGSKDASPEVVEATLQSGDLILLCSDGLTKMVKDVGIVALLSPPPATVEQGVRRLVTAANEAGGKDNVTVVLVRYIESL
jgi:protein phosphatase